MAHYLYLVWPILEPLVTLFVGLVGPVLVTWIALKVISILGIKGEADQKALEAQIRDALHRSATNGWKSVLGERGLSAVTNAQVLEDPSLAEAVKQYIRSLNPEGAAKVTPEQLDKIISSKIPDVTTDNNPTNVVVTSEVGTEVKK